MLRYFVLELVFLGCMPMQDLMVKPKFRPISGPPYEPKSDRDGGAVLKPRKSVVQANSKNLVRRNGVRGF